MGSVLSPLFTFKKIQPVHWTEFLRIHGEFQVEGNKLFDDEQAGEIHSIGCFHLHFFKKMHNWSSL